MGFDIVRFEEVSSTNDLALSLGADAKDGTVIVADTQTAGKGRMGRTWTSFPGQHLFFSLILNKKGAGLPGGLVTTAAALAVVRAIEISAGVRANVKWPNDIVAGRKKLAGILAEQKKDVLVVGVGVNLNCSSADIPDGLKEKAVSLEALSGERTDRDSFLALVLDDLGRSIGTLPEGSASLLSRAWELSSLRDRDVTVKEEGSEVRGRAVGLGLSGSLKMEMPDGRIKEIFSGEVINGY